MSSIILKDIRIKKETMEMRKRTVISSVMFLLFTFSFFLPWRTQAQSSADYYATDLLQSAYSYYAMKNCNETRNICNKVLSIKGISGSVKGKAYRYLGECYIGNNGIQGNPLVAIYNFENVLKIPDADQEDKTTAQEYIDLLEEIVKGESVR